MCMMLRVFRSTASAHYGENTADGRMRCNSRLVDCRCYERDVTFASARYQCRARATQRSPPCDTGSGRCLRRGSRRWKNTMPESDVVGAQISRGTTDSRNDRGVPRDLGSDGRAPTARQVDGSGPAITLLWLKFDGAPRARAARRRKGKNLWEIEDFALTPV